MAFSKRNRLSKRRSRNGGNLRKRVTGMYHNLKSFKLFKKKSPSPKLTEYEERAEELRQRAEGLRQYNERLKKEKEQELSESEKDAIATEKQKKADEAFKAEQKKQTMIREQNANDREVARQKTLRIRHQSQIDEIRKTKQARDTVTVRHRKKRGWFW